MTRRYVVVYENGQNHLSGYAPDLPGCGSIGRSMEELRENLHDEVLLHLRKIACSGRPIPEPMMGLEDVRGSYAELMSVRLGVGTAWRSPLRWFGHARQGQARRGHGLIYPNVYPQQQTQIPYGNDNKKYWADRFRQEALG